MPTGPAGKAYTFVGGSNLMVFKSSKHQNEAWALMKFLSEDQTQKDYADLLGMFPARLAPQQQVGDSDENHKAFFSGHPEGRTYAPIPQWGQIENAYKTRFGNILDSAAGVGQGLQRGDREVRARRRGEGGRRAPRPGRLVDRTSSRQGARGISPAPPRGARPP